LRFRKWLDAGVREPGLLPSRFYRSRDALQAMITFGSRLFPYSRRVDPVRPSISLHDPHIASISFRSRGSSSLSERLLEWRESPSIEPNACRYAGRVSQD